MRTSSPAILEARGWLQAYRGHQEKVDLSQAAPPYLPAPQLLARLKEIAAIPEFTKYGPVQGEPELRSAYAKHVSQIYDTSITAEQVAITAGCNQALFISVLLTAQSGKKIILPTPYYFNHKMTLDMLGIETVELRCQASDAYVPNPDAIADLIDRDVAAIILTTPNNPTGTVYPASMLRTVAELCRERDLWLIIDETYRDFIPEGRPHDAFNNDVRDNLISLYSFSKSLALPGYRLGAMIFPESLGNQITKVQDCVQICPGRVGQIAVTWALTALETWRAEKRQEFIAKGEAFKQLMEGANGWQIASMGAYFAYLRHPFQHLAAKDLAERLATENGLLVIPGTYFGEGQERYLRLSFGNLTSATFPSLVARLTL